MQEVQNKGSSPGIIVVFKVCFFLLFIYLLFFSVGQVLANTCVKQILLKVSQTREAEHVSLRGLETRGLRGPAAHCCPAFVFLFYMPFFWIPIKG